MTAAMPRSVDGGIFAIPFLRSHNERSLRNNNSTSRRRLLTSAGLNNSSLSCFLMCRVKDQVANPSISFRAGTFLKAKIGLVFRLQPMSQLCVGLIARPFGAMRVAGHLSDEVRWWEVFAASGPSSRLPANDVLRAAPLSALSSLLS
jgi:hypothetical protein